MYSYLTEAFSAQPPVWNITEPELYNVEGVGKLYLRSNFDFVQTPLIKGEIFDKEIFDKILKHTKKNSTALDIGAYIGHMSIGMKNAGANKVYSFEPNKDLKKQLQMNLSINKVPGKLFDIALSDKNEILYTKKFNNDNLGHLIWDNSREPQSEETKAITLDSLNFKNVSLIKIDVEGGEKKVLKGAKNTIKNNRPIILIEDFNGFDNNKKLAKQYNYNNVQIIKEHNYIWLP